MNVSRSLSKPDELGPRVPQFSHLPLAAMLRWTPPGGTNYSESVEITKCAESGTSACAITMMSRKCHRCDHTVSDVPVSAYHLHHQTSR